MHCCCVIKFAVMLFGVEKQKINNSERLKCVHRVDAIGLWPRGANH